MERIKHFLLALLSVKELDQLKAVFSGKPVGCSGLDRDDRELKT